MIWDEIYKNADGMACGSDELDAKDEARYQVGQLVLDELGIDIEKSEIPEEKVDFYAEKWNIIFDKEGNIVNYEIN